MISNDPYQMFRGSISLAESENSNSNQTTDNQKINAMNKPDDARNHNSGPSNFSINQNPERNRQNDAAAYVSSNSAEAEAATRFNLDQMSNAITENSRVQMERKFMGPTGADSLCSPSRPIPSMVFTNNSCGFVRKPSDQNLNASQNSEGDDAEVSLNAGEISLLQKKIYTSLRDPENFEIDRSDPQSPLYSLKTFEELNIGKELLQGIIQMGFRKPSKIQEVVLPHLLGTPPRNVIAQSQSGTGKTGAFSLTILSRINPNVLTTQALIIAPTFELALQIGEVIQKMAQFLPHIQVAYAVRGNHTSFVRGELIQAPIVVGTPGTVEEWCYKLRILNLSTLTIFCVDEADVMIETQGFKQTSEKLAKSVNQERCQFMLFSATYTDKVLDFAKTIVPNPLTLRLKKEKQALQNIFQFYIVCQNDEEKYRVVESCYLFLNLGQSMIFCRTKRSARDLHIRMAKDGHSVRELTAALEISQRASIIKLFREGNFRVLISTNVSSRGIDIDDMSLVINYDMPLHVENGAPDYETYLHRIGRCGRFGKIGHAFNLIAPHEEKYIESIVTHFGKPIQRINVEDIQNMAEQN